MILANLTKDAAGKLRAFEVNNHGESYVCAAVSVLVINTVNSIEALTAQEFDCAHDDEAGLVRFVVKGELDSGAELLLESLRLGLASIQEMYPHEFKMQESNWKEK